MDNQVSNNFIYIGGVYSGYNAATTIIFSTGLTTTTETGTERMRITNSGSVGIGITNPTAKIQSEVGNTTSVGLLSASGLAITSAGGSTGNIYQVAFG